MPWNSKNILSLCILVLILNSCSLFREDMTHVNSLIQNSDYLSAIQELDSMESGFAKKLNSRVHVDYGIKVLKDLKVDKKERYQKAKDIFEKASALDPKNKEAKTYYLMVLKLSRNV